MTDPISDMLTQIRNAQAVGKPTVLLSHSKIKLNLAKVLKKGGYIEEVDKIRERMKKMARKNFIKISLKYTDGTSPIREIKQISKPGRRVYVSREKIPRVLNGRGMAVISTSQGLMTDEEARKKGLGGEVICEIW